MEKDIRADAGSAKSGSHLIKKLNEFCDTSAEFNENLSRWDSGSLESESGYSAGDSLRADGTKRGREDDDDPTVDGVAEP